MADFTKSGAQVDEWAQIAAAAIRVGADVSIPDDIGFLFEITLCHDSINAHANGALVTVEVSGNTTGDEDWSELTSFRSTGGTAVKQDVDVESTGSTLYLQATASFETKNDRYFIKNNTIANSEIIRNNGFGSNDFVTPMDALTNTQQTTADAFNVVDQWVIRVPKEARRARVVVWNDDADCTICSRTRRALATDIV